MTDKHVHVGENSIKIGQYQRYVLSAYMKSWWWAYALPLVACVALSVVNINFLFVAIVLLFLVYTMILYIVVLYFVVVPECRFSIMPKEMDLTENGILLTLKKKVQCDEQEESLPEYKIIKEIIEWNRILRIEAKDDSMLLVFKRPRFSFLVVPYRAFDDEQHLREALSVIRFYID